MIQKHPKARFPKGFKCFATNCGMKTDGGKDLSIFVSERTAAAAAVFTRNLFPGAPVVLGREIIKNGRLRVIVANSKVSNVGTGRAGLENARKTAAAAAAEFGVPVEEVIMSSTGVIAKPLPVALIQAGIKGASNKLVDDPLFGAEGIMTTDTRPKAVSTSVGDATVCLVAKGSGMIEPNMATMLVYIFTDADFEPETLDRLLRKAVDKSFNMLSIDSDTSTSDTCVIMANGLAGGVDQNAFLKALTEICVEMTKILAIDGEGATKLLIGEVAGARSKADAVTIAKSLVNSPLIKTMAYGADPNIGRVLMAVGKCVDCLVVPEKIQVAINDVVVFKEMERRNFDEDQIRRLLGGREVRVSVDLGVGDDVATAFGCDLTEGYIKENAAYYSS